MTIRSVIIIQFILLPINLLAQNAVDSIKSLITSEISDSLQIEALLYSFRTDLYFTDQQAVIGYQHRAIQLSQSIVYPSGEIDAHNNLGYIYRSRSEIDSAIYHYKNSIDLAEENNLYKGLTDAYIGLGNTYNQLNKWSQALVAFDKALNISQINGDSIQMGSTYNNIGNTYLSQERFEKALENYHLSISLGDDPIREIAAINVAVVHNKLGNNDKARDYFGKSLELAKRLKNEAHIAFIHKNLGILEKNARNYDEAIKQYNRALKTYLLLSDDFNRSEVIQNLGNVFYEKKEYRAALDYYNRSLKIQNDIDYPSAACYSHLYKSKVFRALGIQDSLMYELRESESCADTLELVYIKMDVAQMLSGILEENGQYKKSLAYQKQFKLLSDSINTINSKEKIAELDTKYQTSQKEQEIQLLNTENQLASLELEQTRNLRNYLIITSVILSLLIATVISRYRIKDRANRKLRELDLLKTNFFTNISHELRTPLTLVLNPINKLIDNEDDDSKLYNLKLAERNASRLLDLTNQLLELSKLEAGKLQLQVSKGEIKDFVGVIAASFESLASSQGITFNLEMVELPDSSWFDRDKLQKILNNLLSNAFKATPESGSVTLSVSAYQSKIIFAVKDSGIGLSPEQQVNIFDRFHQEEHQGYEGTGVGLTLTKELVELHKGTIHLKSGINQGSTFTVKIPYSQSAYLPTEITSEITGMTPATLTKQETVNKTDDLKSEGLPIVLLVEDNSDLRRFMTDLLNDNYQVMTATNGKEGLAKALEVIPDIILSDWMMPEMNGEALCQQLKTNQHTSHIPIILLTAKADKPSKLEGLNTGADDYITKPFDNEELLARIQNLIEQRKMLQAKYGDTITLAPSKVQITDPDKIFIEKAIATVNDHINDLEFSVEKFQSEMAMSRMQLHRKLKALTAQSASEFIRGLRLQRAADLLSTNGQQVADIAYQCGFNSVSYFAQCFKEKYGVTPSEYKSESQVAS